MEDQTPTTGGSWLSHVKKTMKANPGVKFGKALKLAAKTWKKTRKSSKKGGKKTRKNKKGGLRLSPNIYE